MGALAEQKSADGSIGPSRGLGRKTKTLKLADESKSKAKELERSTICVYMVIGAYSNAARLYLLNIHPPPPGSWHVRVLHSFTQRLF